MSDVSETAEFLIIRGEEYLVIAAGAHGDDIVHVRVLRVKVEDKDQTAALIGQHMVVLAEQLQLRGPFAEKAGIPDCVDHAPVEGIQLAVLEIAVFHQTPLAAAVLVAPAVALAGEIDPLGMAELVAHEVEVGGAAGGGGEQTQHLMQSHGAVDDLGMTNPVHVGIHAGAGQTEHHGLVAHQGLVVAFHIGHRRRHADRELVPDGIEVPGLVLLLLNQADPHVRQPHGQTVVKADAAALDGDAHTGHAGHVLGNGDGVGADLADQGVGQLQIGDGLGVGVHGKVHPEIGKGGAQTVIVVEHTGDAVKTEAVEVILLQPELQV